MQFLQFPLLNVIDTMQLNNEDNNGFNIFDDIEENFEYIGHINL